MATDQSKKQDGCYPGSTKRARNGPCCYADGHLCHLKMRNWNQKYESQAVLQCDIVKDASGSYAVFTEQGSSASQMTTAKVMDVITRLPDFSGQAAGATSTHTPSHGGTPRNRLKIPKVRMSRCVDTSSTTQNGPKSWS